MRSTGMLKFVTISTGSSSATNSSYDTDAFRSTTRPEVSFPSTESIVGLSTGVSFIPCVRLLVGVAPRIRRLVPSSRIRARSCGSPPRWRSAAPVPDIRTRPFARWPSPIAPFHAFALVSFASMSRWKWREDSARSPSTDPPTPSKGRA